MQWFVTFEGSSYQISLFLLLYFSFCICRNFKLKLTLPLFWLLTDPLQRLFSVFWGLSNLWTRVSISQISFVFGIIWMNPGYYHVWRMLWPCMTIPWERYLDQRPDSSPHQIVLRNFSLLKTPFLTPRSSTEEILYRLSKMNYQVSVQPTSLIPR